MTPAQFRRLHHTPPPWPWRWIPAVLIAALTWGGIGLAAWFLWRM